MTTKKHLLGSAVMLLLEATGCGPPLEPSGTPGALRSGGFVYCDPAGHCGENEPLPEGIAVGAVFELEFDGYEDAVLGSANEDLLELARWKDGRPQFRALVPGPATVEARSSFDGELIDTITLTLTRAESLRPGACARVFNAITKSEQMFDPFNCTGDDIGGSGVAISRGASLAPTVCVMPMDASGAALSGLLAGGGFRASGAARLEMHVDAGGRCATIGGLALGDTAVTVMAGDLESTFTVRVAP